MKRKLISQREARALRKRVEALESVIARERATWAAEFPGGVHIGSVVWCEDNCTAAGVYTARRLNHAVVAVSDGIRKFNLYALPNTRVP